MVGDRVLSRIGALFERCVRTGLTAFSRDRRGSVTVDFIISLPILLSVLVFTSEYGRVLQMRSALENAVADATRYLSRVPMEEDGTFSQEVLDVANALITNRLNTPYISIGTPVSGTEGMFNTVTLRASAGVETPALSMINFSNNQLQFNGIDADEVDGLVVSAEETARHFGF